ncbi:hypothetical protein ACFWY5_22075 [Nonomuraea sp. NPDC059007]|uniref:hypothetical protein n=1 Tax=Nonomuraea sp. NPDC059007 TaxID=3346692 RepID=UPI0036925FA9
MLPLEINRALPDAVITVSGTAIIEAMAACFTYPKTVVEPGGACRACSLHTGRFMTPSRPALGADRRDRLTGGRPRRRSAPARFRRSREQPFRQSDRLDPFQLDDPGQQRVFLR